MRETPGCTNALFRHPYALSPYSNLELLPFWHTSSVALFSPIFCFMFLFIFPNRLCNCVLVDCSGSPTRAAREKAPRHPGRLLLPQRPRGHRVGPRARQGRKALDFQRDGRRGLVSSYSPRFFQWYTVSGGDCIETHSQYEHHKQNGDGICL